MEVAAPTTNIPPSKFPARSLPIEWRRDRNGGTERHGTCPVCDWVLGLLLPATAGRHYSIALKHEYIPHGVGGGTGPSAFVYLPSEMRREDRRPGQVRYGTERGRGVRQSRRRGLDQNPTLRDSADDLTQVSDRVVVPRFGNLAVCRCGAVLRLEPPIV
jgi:hypothetical protein